MNRKFNVIAVAVAIGLILYIIESLIFYIEFKNDYTFLQALLTDVPFWQIVSRLLILAGFIVFGLIVYGKIKEITLDNQFSQPKNLRSTKAHFDYNFLAGLSFQMRTPLNAIIGFSELLKNHGQCDESKEICIEQINSSSKYLLLLINNVSEISKIESNELTINRSAYNVNKVIEEQFEEFQSQKVKLGKSGVSLVLEHVKLSEKFILLTDSKRLKQVFENLIENALGISDEGIIKIGYTIKDNGFVEFFVSDSGSGLSQEKLDSILLRYNKLTDDQNIPFDGYVLRLAVSKSIVKLLGGEIKAEARSGKGTIIYFTIPHLKTIEKENETMVTKKSVLPGSINWSDRLLLIAEDVDSNYIYLEELLKPTRIKILWAKNGQEAVEMIKQNPQIELVLLDILMPVMDGYQASRELKALRPNLPIVAQTACVIEGNEKSEQNRYFDDFLTKPIWSPQLFAVLDKYIY